MFPICRNSSKIGFGKKRRLYRYLLFQGVCVSWELGMAIYIYVYIDVYIYMCIYIYMDSLGRALRPLVHGICSILNLRLRLLGGPW